MEQPEPAEGTSGPPPSQQDLQQRFVRDVQQTIFINFFGRRIYSEARYGRLTNAVARATKTPYVASKNLGAYVGEDYDKCLDALAACYEILTQATYTPYAQQFDQLLVALIEECCHDLNLRWEEGHFVRQ